MSLNLQPEIKVAERLHDLTPFIVVNHLGITDLGARLCRAVYHPSSSLSRKQGVTKEPLLLLKMCEDLNCFRNTLTADVPAPAQSAVPTFI